MPTPDTGQTGNGTKSTGQSQNLRRLLLGSSVSVLGSRVTTIAYPMLVLYLTGSPVAAGWVGFAATAPSILVYVPAGALVDRWNPRRTMLISEIGRGAAVAAVVAAICLGQVSVPLLIVLAVVEESLEVFSTLAERRYVGALVEPGQASWALARSEARTHLAVLAGRPLGGFLFGLAPVVPFVLDVVSFIVSASSLVSIRGRLSAWHPVPRPRPAMPHLAHDAADKNGKEAVSWLSGHRAETEFFKLGHEVWDGIIWIHRNRFVRAALPLASSTTLIAQALIMIFLAEAHKGHMSSLSVGVVLAASGVGGTIGSAAGSRIAKYTGWLEGQLFIWAVPLIILAILNGRSLFWMAAAIFVFGFTGAVGNIQLNSYLMRQVSASKLARILSISQLISFGAFAFGAVLGGMLAQWCGARLGIWVLLILVMALAVISVRTLPDHAAPVSVQVIVILGCAIVVSAGTLVASVRAVVMAVRSVVLFARGIRALFCEMMAVIAIALVNFEKVQTAKTSGPAVASPVTVEAQSPRNGCGPSIGANDVPAPRPPLEPMGARAGG